MAFLGDLYDFELSHYGITFCEDHEDGDRLIIAPGLKGHPYDLEVVEVYGSPIETLDYLHVGDQLVGVGYLLFAGFINYFLNSHVPDEVTMHDVSDLAMLGINDLTTRSVFREGEYERSHAVYLTAQKLIADMPPIPADILKRVREHLAETYSFHTIH